MAAPHRALRVLVPAGVFIYLAFARTRDITESFWLAGDQIRDWNIALKSWCELPLTGTPSSVGGSTLGPVFYWTLWSIRHVIGPWTENLPHAGGIGLSIIQSAADVALLAALWRATSLTFALAITLCVATAPQDMALTATIWNPPLAVALVKVSIAAALLGESRRSLGWTVLTTASAWLAVQAHSAAIFVAIPVLAVGPLMARREQDPTVAWKHLGVALLVVMALQIPFAIDVWARPVDQRLPGLIAGGVSGVLTDPSTLRPAASFGALGDAASFILIGRTISSWTAVLIAASMTLVIVRRRQPPMLLVSIVPLVLTVLGFATWQNTFDHYWYLPLMPSVAITIGIAVTSWRPALTAAVLLLAVLAFQPARLAQAATIARLPEYRLLVDASRTIRRDTPIVTAINTELSLPATTDPSFIYRVLGGQVRDDGPLAATIAADGRVRYGRR